MSARASLTTDEPRSSVEAWSGKDRGDENFPVGSLLIRRNLRTHVHAFYAFARNADDIADSPTLAPDEKLQRLDQMEAVLLGRAPDARAPTAARLRASLAETTVSAIHAKELLIAFRADATKLRYATWDELYDYCRYSAMPVGRYVLDLHGESKVTYQPSDALCVALQVLNHIQDCQKDLVTLDRSYLPADLLARHRARVEDVKATHASAGLRAVFDALLERVGALNACARGLPERTQSRRLRLETAVIIGLSRALTKRLTRHDPVAARVALRRTDVALSLGTALGFLL